MSNRPQSLRGIKKETWFKQPLTIFVFGASGDLAKKKTFPALLDLFVEELLPENFQICGYARSKKKDEEFKKQIRPFLEKRIAKLKNKDDAITDFLSKVFYRNGGYGDTSVMKKVSAEAYGKMKSVSGPKNRVFYFALPPNVFLETAKSVHKSMMLKKSHAGFVRVVVEKPFGNDTESAKKLLVDLGAVFPEEQLYRIDHYLGKELVQNIQFLRFANTLTEAVWSREYIKSVTITFKEDIGTDGRGGYFENAGIIRDIIQNHLMQVLSLIAMEPPIKLTGKNSSRYIRDEKVKVLRCIRPMTLENCVLGQYKGYRDDPTVKNDSKRETYCCCIVYIENKRWDGVPFILKAGKALNERKAEVRLQMKHPPGYKGMFNHEIDLPPQDIVIRLQPDEAIYIKTNVKKPGLGMNLLESELDLTYKDRHPDAKSFDAYTRLILDVLRGRQSAFVRGDEAVEAWEIVTPVLNQIESGKDFELLEYERGSRGPAKADQMIKKLGFMRSSAYAENFKKRKD